MHSTIDFRVILFSEMRILFEMSAQCKRCIQESILIFLAQEGRVNSMTFASKWITNLNSNNSKVFLTSFIQK